MFNNLKSDGLEQAEDRLGGFQPLPTDIYPVTLSYLYAGQSAGGAKNVTIVGKTEDGREYSETIYVTNKNGENWFANKQDPSKKVPLPGYTTVNDLCLIALGKPLAETEWEEKAITRWDADSGSRKPQSTQACMEVQGAVVHLAISRVIENKTKKEGNEYVAIAEERSSNAIDKVFDTDTHLTVVEAQNGAEKGVFYDSWLERNKGKDVDKRSIKDGQGGTAGAPPKAAGSAPAQGAPKTNSLFNKK